MEENFAGSPGILAADIVSLASLEKMVSFKRMP